MSATTPAELAQRLYQQAEATRPDPIPYLDQAREEIIDKLISGKTVNKMTSRDIFDSAMDGSYHNVLDLLDSILSMNDKTGYEYRLCADECADKAKRVIESFVDSKQDWILERASEIAHDEEDNRE